MDNALEVVHTNLFDAASLIASDGAVKMPVSKLQDPHVLKRWRSLTLTPYVVTSSIGPFDTPSIRGMTVSRSCKMRVRASSVDGTGAAGDLYDSDDDYPGGIAHGDDVFDADYGALTIRLPASVTGYLRFDWNEAGAGRTYVEAGRAFVGVRTAFAFNFAPGSDIGWRDNSIVEETAGGQTLVWRKSKYRVFNFSLDWITESQRFGIVETMDRVNGKTDDILFIIDPESSNLARDSILGLATDLTPIAFRNIYDGDTHLFSKQWQIKERL